MKKFLPAFIFCLFLMVGIPRMLSLDAHWNSDEARWLNRSTDFMSAVKQGRFSDTLVAYHPGVMTMWIAGLRTFFMEGSVDVPNLAHARWFLGIAIWIGIGVCVTLVYRLFGRWEAFTSIAFLAFSPFYLAQTRRVHTDALAALFILLAVLLFLLYCENRYKHRYLVLSGVTFGLAILAKSYSLILVIWVPVCLFLFLKNRNKYIQGILTSVAELVCFFSYGLLTIIVFWPIFWNFSFGLLGISLLCVNFVLLQVLKRHRNEKSETSLKGMLLPLMSVVVVLGLILLSALQSMWLVLDRVNWAVTTPHEVEHFFLGKVVYDPGWLFYPFVLSIKSTPLILPLVFVGIFVFWKRRKHSVDTENQFRKVLALFAVVLVFVLCLSATSKKFSRYLLPAFSILEILAALSLVGILRWLYGVFDIRFKSKTLVSKRSLTFVTCVLFFFIQVLPVLGLHPYYGTYYNSCWKVLDITKIITVGEASGLDIAAHHLNSKPNAENLVVQVSPLAAEFVYHYFKGKVYRSDRQTNLNPNYEVVYIRDSQIGRVPETGTLNGELEHQISLNGIDHVWIYRIEPKEN